MVFEVLDYGDMYTVMQDTDMAESCGCIVCKYSMGASLRWCLTKSGCGRQTHSGSGIKEQSCMIHSRLCRFADLPQLLHVSRDGCSGRMMSKADLSAKPVDMMR